MNINFFRGTSYIILETTDGKLSNTTGFLQDTAIIVYSKSGKTLAFGMDPDFGRKVTLPDTGKPYLCLELKL